MTNETIPPGGATCIVSVNALCPEGCGVALTLPAEMLRSQPASGGMIEVTLRLTATTEIEHHLLTHWG